MAFVDLMIREAYWMQRDVAALQLENPELADQLPLVERIGSIGGLVIWDSSNVTVSFLGRAVSDDALAVFEDFVLVDGGKKRGQVRTGQTCPLPRAGANGKPSQSLVKSRARWIRIAISISNGFTKDN